MATIPESIPDYERSDANIGLVAALGAGLAGLLVLAPITLRFIYPASLDAVDPKPPAAIAAGPRLQIDPQADLARFRREEDRRLGGYGYVGPSRQTVHIPIDRAMTLLSQRGLPGWTR
jgi:hypothetical protein